MMPKILVTVETNQVEQVADVTFEVHPTLAWHTVENDAVRSGWQYNPNDNTVTDPSVAYLASPEGKRSQMVESRILGYGLIGDQLDAIYRDMRDGTSVFVDHITAVKERHPRVDAVDSGDRDRVLNPNY